MKAAAMPAASASWPADGSMLESTPISEETVPKPDPDKLRSAAADLAQKYPAEDVSLYLSTLVSQDPETWKELASLPQTTGA